MEDFPFHALDVAIFVILIWSAMVGFIRGIVKEVAAILAWIVAIVGAAVLFPHAQPWVEKYVDIPVVTNAITGFGLFLILLLVCRLVFATLRTKAEGAQANGLDRGLGFVFGLARAALILCLILLAADGIISKEDRPAWLNDFQSRPLLEKGGQVIKAALPEDLWDKIKKDMEALQKLSEEKKEKKEEELEEKTSPEDGEPVEESPPESSGEGEVGL